MSTTLSQPAPRPSVTATALTPPGYRRTEVGTIPCDWGVSSVGAEFRIQLGKMLDAAKNTGVLKPYIGNRSVQWGRIDLDGIATVPITMSDLQRFLLRRGDLLVCEGGEIGRAAIWKDLIPECSYQKAIHRLRPIRTYDAYLMMSLLQLWASTGYLANYVTQTSIAHLPKDKLEVVPLPVPPPAEQHAIAEALSDVDGLLSALEALIAKKRAIKQAAMQQLLTGKTRLPGFSGEWVTMRIGDTCTCLPTANNPRADLNEHGDVEYIHYGDVHAYPQPVLDCSCCNLPRIKKSRIGNATKPGFPFWPSWSVYDSRLPAAMQRFSHCCQVRYSFRCRSGLRMLADHGVPAKPEGPLATPLPRRPSATRVRWLFRAVDVTLRAQVAPKSAAACRRTTSGSDAPPQAATNNIARASRAVRPSSSADAASSSATSF